MAVAEDFADSHNCCGFDVDSRHHYDRLRCIAMQRWVDRSVLEGIGPAEQRIDPLEHNCSLSRGRFVCPVRELLTSVYYLGPRLVTLV